MPIDENKLIELLTDFKGEIIQSVDHRLEKFRDDIKADFRHQLGVQREDCVFRAKLTTDSDPNRPPVPTESVH